MTRSENLKHAWKNKLFDRKKRIRIASKKGRERSNPIYSIDLCTLEITEFKGMWQVKEFGYERGCIYRVLNGKQTHHQNKFWSRDVEILKEIYTNHFKGAR